MTWINRGRGSLCKTRRQKPSRRMGRPGIKSCAIRHVAFVYLSQGRREENGKTMGFWTRRPNGSVRKKSQCNITNIGKRTEEVSSSCNNIRCQTPFTRNVDHFKLASQSDHRIRTRRRAISLQHKTR